MATNSVAWLEGRRAGLEGEAEHKNPYRGADFETWRLGWKTGLASNEQKKHTDA